jgi:arylsulfatase A-like enzyme
MNRRQFFRAAGGAMAEPLAAPLTAARQPNIIVILIDDYGARDLGCYGSSYYETPNIDRLAGEGVRFTNGYAACPVCSPTRASIMTGKYPARLHLTDWIPGRRQWPASKLLRLEFEQQLPLAEITLAEALRPAGYVSASIGKWHLGDTGFLPTEQGFSINVAGTRGGSPRTYFAPFNIPGTEDAEPGEYLSEYLTRRAEGFMEANRDKPFFLYLPHFSVHLPLGGPKELIPKYQAKANPQGHAEYGAMVEAMDKSVGRLMKKLDDLKLAGDTLVFFLADNGGLRYEGSRKDLITSNAPLRAGKGHLYEGGIRVPFLMRWPGRLKPGTVDDAPVISNDIYATSLAAAGVKGAATDGLDLLLPRRREALYWHYPHYSNQGGVPGGAVRAGKWKLIEFYEDSRLELYDLAADPGEKTNLAHRQPAVARKLRGMLDSWRKSAGAHMPQPNPAYDPAKADQGLTGAEQPTPPSD